MKTIKWLKISAILRAVFVLSCLVSVSSLAIYDRMGGMLYFVLGNLSFPLWFLNPIGWVTPLVGWIRYRSERNDSEQLALIGRKWLWFLVGFLFDTIVYLISGSFFVRITGGV